MDTLQLKHLVFKNNGKNVGVDKYLVKEHVE